MNRIMVWILAGLVVVALVYRIANPPPPTPPGPVGRFGSWTSQRSLGEMGPQAVNPSGTAWAGVWNEIPKSGEIRSAVWIIDFADPGAEVRVLPPAMPAVSLGWADDKTIRVLTVDSAKPDEITQSDIVYIDAAKAERKKTIQFKTLIARVLAWPAGSDKMLCELVPEGSAAKLAVMTQDGKIVGKQIAPRLDKGVEFGADAAISKDGNLFVFSVSDPMAKGGSAYYLGDTAQGYWMHAFDLAEVPGRIEGLWIAPAKSFPFAVGSDATMEGPVPAQLLIACSHLNSLGLAQYSRSTKGVRLLKGGLGDQLKTTWSDAPKTMMFATSSGGYQFDLATGKTKQPFNFKKLTDDGDYWRKKIRIARLYPVRGRFISVAIIAGSPDIREFGKDGSLLRDLLPRF